MCKEEGGGGKKKKKTSWMQPHPLAEQVKRPHQLQVTPYLPSTSIQQAISTLHSGAPLFYSASHIYFIYIDMYVTAILGLTQSILTKFTELV